MAIAVQWIGIALSALGLILSGVKEYPQIQKSLSFAKVQDPGQVQGKFLYTTMSVAYDVSTGKHWFHHPDGIWRDVPFSPKVP